MSWHDGRILSTMDLCETSDGQLPSALQVGAPAQLWIVHETGNEQAIPCRVVAVHIGLRNEIRYDVAVAIAGTNLFVPIRGMRGWVTPTDEIEAPTLGGLVDVSEFARQQKVADEGKARRGRLSLVKTEEQQ